VADGGASRRRPLALGNKHFFLFSLQRKIVALVYAPLRACHDLSHAGLAT